MAVTKYLVLERDSEKPDVFRYLGAGEGHSAAQATRAVLGEPGEEDTDSYHVAVPVSNWTVFDSTVEKTKPVRKLTETEWKSPHAVTGSVEDAPASVAEALERAKGDA